MRSRPSNTLAEQLMPTSSSTTQINVPRSISSKVREKGIRLNIAPFAISRSVKYQETPALHARKYHSCRRCKGVLTNGMPYAHSFSSDCTCMKKNSQRATPHPPNSYILVMHHGNATTHLPLLSRAKQRYRCVGSNTFHRPHLPSIPNRPSCAP